MTADQQAAQDMRREVKGQCLWCGAGGLDDPCWWDPELSDGQYFWPVGMCELCFQLHKASHDS